MSIDEFSGWAVRDRGKKLVKKIANVEVSIKKLEGFYRVIVWRLPNHDWVEEQDVEGMDLLRALKLGDKLIEQQQKSH